MNAPTYFFYQKWTLLKWFLIIGLVFQILEAAHAVQTIFCGQTIGNAITNAAQTDNYEFSADAGTVALLTVNGVWTGLGPTHYAVADVYNLSGIKIGTAESVPLRLLLTNSTTYKVLVHADNYSSTGTYGLNLSLPTGQCGPPVYWGRTTSANISHLAQVDAYKLDAESNAVVLITVSGAWTGLGPTHYAVADVFDPSGTEIASCENTSTPPLTLTNAGTYTVLVHAEDYHNGGNYNVTVSYILFPGPPWVNIGTTNGAAALNLYGVLANSTTIQYATNMVNGSNSWRLLTNVILPYVPYQVVDWSSTNVTQRFYRIYQ